MLSRIKKNGPVSTPDISINHLLINDAVKGTWKSSASVKDLITPSKHISSFSRMSKWTCLRDKRMQWLNSRLQPQRSSTLERITWAKVIEFTFRSTAPLVCLPVIVFALSSLWRNVKSKTWKECWRSIGRRTINEVDYNLLQWRSQGSKAMSCWLFNKLQAYTAVRS